MSLSSIKRVAVLRGGPSFEYDVSLKTGGTIISNLSNLEKEYAPVDVLISKGGVWHASGVPQSPQKILHSVDMVINGMHGAYGEDGTVQKILEHFRVPYIGSGVISSALSLNKVLTKELLRKHDIKTPHYITLERDNSLPLSAREVKDFSDHIFSSLPFPLIIKPVSSGSSIGVSYVGSRNDIKNALINAFQYSPKIIVEEYIDGKEVSCGVIEDFRNKDFYTMWPVQVSVNNKKFFDYESKHINIESSLLLEPILSPLEKLQIQELAKEVHKILHLSDYSISDMIIHPRRGIFVLEVNSLPPLSHKSPFIKSLESLGSNIKEFLHHLVTKENKHKK